MTTSSAEAECVVLFTLVKELARLSQVLMFLRRGAVAAKPVALCDSGSAVQMAYSSVASKRGRHVDLRRHYVREHLGSGAFRLKWVRAGSQKADALTKPRPGRVFKRIAQRARLNS